MVGLEQENSAVTASDILEMIAAGEDIHLTRCRISGILDLKAFFTKNLPCCIDKLHTFKEGDTDVLVLPQSLYFNSCTFENDVFYLHIDSVV